MCSKFVRGANATKAPNSCDCNLQEKGLLQKSKCECTSAGLCLLDNFACALHVSCTLSPAPSVHTVQYFVHCPPPRPAAHQ